MPFTNPFLTLDDMRRERAKQLGDTLQGAVASVPQAFLNLEQLRQENEARQRSERSQAEQAAEARRANAAAEVRASARDAEDTRRWNAQNDREGARDQREAAKTAHDAGLDALNRRFGLAGLNDEQRGRLDAEKKRAADDPALGELNDDDVESGFLSLEQMRAEAAKKVAREKGEADAKTRAEARDERALRVKERPPAPRGGAGGGSAAAKAKEDDKAKALARKSADAEYAQGMSTVKALKVGTAAKTQRAMGAQDADAPARAQALAARETELNKQAEEAQVNADQQRDMRRREIDNYIPTVDGTEDEPPPAPATTADLDDRLAAEREEMAQSEPAPQTTSLFGRAVDGVRGLFGGGAQASAAPAAAPADTARQGGESRSAYFARLVASGMTEDQAMALAEKG